MGCSDMGLNIMPRSICEGVQGETSIGIDELGKADACKSRRSLFKPQDKKKWEKIGFSLCLSA